MQMKNICIRTVYWCILAPCPQKTCLPGGRSQGRHWDNVVWCISCIRWISDAIRYMLLQKHVSHGDTCMQWLELWLVAKSLHNIDDTVQHQFFLHKPTVFSIQPTAASHKHTWQAKEWCQLFIGRANSAKLLLSEEGKQKRSCGTDFMILLGWVFNPVDV